MEFRNLFLLAFLSTAAAAGDLYVAPGGSDSADGSAAAPFATIQNALDESSPGTTVHVKPGTYLEKLEFNESGSADGGYITLMSDGGRAVISGNNVDGENLILIENQRYIKVIGFELRDNLKVDDGSGIRIIGSGDHIELRNNLIHNIRGDDAMGITVYGTSGAAPISDLIIDGNEIRDCDPARSEALTLNGNVTRALVSNNLVSDVNNIGIDFIGGEGMCPVAELDAARECICRGNRVFRARSIYDEGFAAGIYVDGGRDIVIENNIVSECDLGIEVGAENPGIVTTNVIVRSNIVYRNDKVGIVFGGFASDRGRVRNSRFANNTCYFNDTLAAGFGELWIQFADGNTIANNIFAAGPQQLLFNGTAGNVNNTFDYNLWFASSGAASALFIVNDNDVTGFDAFRATNGGDANSLFADPLLMDASNADFHLKDTSPALQAGDPATTAESSEADLDGKARIQDGRVEIGADERGEAPGGTVDGSGFPVPSDLDTLTDSDGDGFPDELEMYLNTSSTDPNDTPLGGGAVTPADFAVTKLRIKLTFNKGSRDSLSLQGTVPVGADFEAEDAPVAISVGGVLGQWTLDDKGKAKTISESISFKLPKSGAGSATLKVAFKKGNQAFALRDEGLLNSDASGQLSIPVFLIFDQRLFKTTYSGLYKAREDRSASLR
jgi:hypothetical protein